jgi:hypothetical protein
VKFRENHDIQFLLLEENGTNLNTSLACERQINYRALTFAFTGTLVFSSVIGFLQKFGFHSVPWLGIPVLMISLWSFGLILYSWRYR